MKQYLSKRKTLIEKYAGERKKNMVPVIVSPVNRILLSPGKHNQLIRSIIEDFLPHFVPDGCVLYIGDTGDKWVHYDSIKLSELGVEIDSHGKMPDVVIFDPKRNWLFLIEAVSSHGPVDSKRHNELMKLFVSAQPGIVYVTAFSDRKMMARYLPDIAWETEVWVADSPSHLIHFDGERFMGPYS